MFAYKGVLHAGKYVGKKAILDNQIKLTKIKLAQQKNKARMNYFQIQKLEKTLKHLIDEQTQPFLL